MNNVNQKIINAVIEKAEKVCPDSLALIGIYGSVATGDEYEKSDLDLLILIQNDEGWQLGTGFILDDRKVGYDIYCTTWNGLRYDSECHHAQISKLMDSKIVYIKNQQDYDELCKLREQAKCFLLSEERFQRVNELVNKAKISYADACLHETLGQVRLGAFGVIYYLVDAVMLFYGEYFKRGTKRMLEELASLPVETTFIHNIKRITESKDIFELRALAKNLLLYADQHLKRKKDKAEPSESLAGTYEEIYSNWRNKVEKATRENDCFASFMNMCNLHYMFAEISSDIDIGTFNILEAYNPDCLEKNIELFDTCLKEYEKAYKAAGIPVRHFSSVDAFVEDYLGLLTSKKLNNIQLN